MCVMHVFHQGINLVYINHGNLSEWTKYTSLQTSIDTGRGTGQEAWLSKVHTATAILKLRLRATLEFGIFLPPLQLPNLMAKASMDRYHYLPKKDPKFPRRHTLGKIQPRVSPQRCSVRLRRKMHVTHTKYTYGQTQTLAISSACDRLTLTV